MNHEWNQRLQATAGLHNTVKSSALGDILSISNMSVMKSYAPVFSRQETD